MSLQTMGPSRLICRFIGVVLLWKSPGFSAASRVNVALNGKASHSSTWSMGVPERTIDGNTDSEWLHSSCSATENELNPWWRVELPAVYKVSEIEVTNRNEERALLNGVEIRIGNSEENNGNNNPRCAVINDKQDCLTQTVKCWGMEGRFINFYQPSDDRSFVQLCEVKVYGELAAPSISIQTDQRNFTLVGTRMCWSDALLYCRDSHWDLLSLTGPEDQEMIDELVARAPFPLTSYLWVGLRRARLGNSWFWMSGDLMGFTQWDQGLQHSSPCGVVSSMERSTWIQRSCGEHLHFICFTGPTEGVNKTRFYSSTREKQMFCI